MDVVLAQPRGFCAGVDRAIEIVERALVLHGAPIYVRHEIVHNRFVVADLRAKGAVFVEELDDVPAGSTVIFSAHGVAKGGAGRSCRARAAYLRCDLPAGHQGACRSRQDARPGARDRDDRSRRPSGSRRARWARRASGMYLVETIEDVEQACRSRASAPCVRDADDAVDRRCRRSGRSRSSAAFR